MHKFCHISLPLTTTVAAAPVAKSKFIVSFMQITLPPLAHLPPPSPLLGLCSSGFYSVLQLCDRAKVKLKPFFLKVHFRSMAKRKISVKNFANHSPPSSPPAPQAGRQAELVATHHGQPSSDPLEGRTTTACCTFPYTTKASSAVSPPPSCSPYSLSLSVSLTLSLSTQHIRKKI